MRSGWFYFFLLATLCGCETRETKPRTNAASAPRAPVSSAEVARPVPASIDQESTMRFELRGAKLLASLKRGATIDLERYYESAIASRDRTRGGNLDAYAVTSYIGTQAALKYDEYNSRIDAWIGASPNNPLPYLIRAEMNYRKAWKARGHGYAGSVQANSWGPFYQLILSAKNDLDRALTINPKDPVALVMMIDIARVMGAPKQGVRHFFDRAVKEVPNYYQAYAAMNLTLSPQWGGSFEEQIAFLRPDGKDSNKDLMSSIILVDTVRDHVCLGRVLPRQIAISIKWEVLRDICEAALTAYPRAGLYGAWCGELAAALAHHDDAKRFLQQAARVDPENEAVHTTTDRVRRKYRTPV